MTFKHALSSGLLASVATLAACEFPARNPSDPIQQVVQVVVVPESLSLAPAQQFKFGAYGRTASGDSAAVAVSWSASGGSIAPDGMFAADTAVGEFQVSATSAALKLSAASWVRIRRRPVASVTVTPASVSVQVGQTAQLAAMPRDSAGNALPRRAVTWASDNPGVATVDGTGLVTANAGGSATITATSEGRSGGAAVSVTSEPVPAPVATVDVTPASLSLTVAQTGQLTATPRDSSGAPLTGRVVTWASSNTAVATVDGSGLVTANAAGSATITATSEGRSGSAAVSVTSQPVATPVARVDVTPASLGLTVAQTGQLTATPRDSSGAPLAGRVVTWASSNTVVATVNASGLVTAKAAGSATITATSEGQSGSAAVTVTNKPVATVDVTPASLSLTVAQTGQLTATPRDSSGAPLTGRVVSWASSNTVVATVNASGLVTAKAAGSATITATSEGQSGSATVTVTAATALTGLDFPGNVSVQTVRFEFTSPFAAYPATYIWRVYPRQQGGYYTSFFHANNSSNFNNQYQYYGFHPYPEPPPPLVGTEKWEISVDGGADITGAPVVFNRWYLQVAVVSKDASGTHHTYYWDWPDTTHKIVWDGSLYAAAPNPAIMVGDNPWNPGEEVYNGIMRGFQFYNVALTPSQIAQEISAPGSVRAPWYLNLNPTPGDISDKSGSGNHPAWVGTARPALWTGSGP